MMWISIDAYSHELQHASPPSAHCTRSLTHTLTLSGYSLPRSHISVTALTPLSQQPSPSISH
ncbi:hypothetical protein LZ31DRAFT_557171 [Colletotrichum somersetense]|nr:hypothetical protein LZ31DRAFT_557171 [Colletotrichum somersetense]